MTPRDAAILRKDTVSLLTKGVPFGTLLTAIHSFGPLIMISSRHPFALLLIVAVGMGLSSCDSIADTTRPTEITFDGVTYEILGQAQFEQSDAGLVVSNIGSSGADGVRVAPDMPIYSAHIRTSPVSIPANGRWGMQVFGEISSGRTALATVWNEAVNAEEHEIQFDFAPEMNVSSTTIEYYLEGRLQHSTTVPLSSAANQSARVATAGRGTGGPMSVYVICVGGELIVATDHGGDAPRTGPGGCAAELLTNVPGTEEPVCVDFVQAIPVTDTAFPEATSLEITGRTLPLFTITSGEVEAY